jgi:hypothetical protein
MFFHSRVLRCVDAHNTELQHCVLCVVSCLITQTPELPPTFRLSPGPLPTHMPVASLAEKVHQSEQLQSMYK